MEFAYINELAHSAIWFVGIKEDLTFEAYSLNDKFREFTDGQLLACADIDVAVADFSEGWDCTTTTSWVIAVNNALSFYAIVRGGFSALCP